MTWRKDGLLLAIGGLAGLAMAAVLESNDENSEDVQETDALESLISDIRQEAEWAMVECSTDEEREKVYAQVKESVRNFQLTLQQRSEEIIADLQEQAMDAPDREEIASELDERVAAFKQRMDQMSARLDETLAANRIQYRGN